MIFNGILVLVDRTIGRYPPFRVINRFQVQRARAALGTVVDAVRVVLRVAGRGGGQHEFGEFLPGEVVEQAVFTAGEDVKISRNFFSNCQIKTRLLQFIVHYINAFHLFHSKVIMFFVIESSVF